MNIVAHFQQKFKIDQSLAKSISTDNFVYYLLR